MDINKKWEIVHHKMVGKMLRGLIRSERFYIEINSSQLFDDILAIYETLSVNINDFEWDSNFQEFLQEYQFDNGEYGIFFNSFTFFGQIDSLFSFYTDYIEPYKSSDVSNPKVRSLISSIGERIKIINERKDELYSYVFEEPFEISFDPFLYMSNDGIMGYKGDNIEELLKNNMDIDDMAGDVLAEFLIDIRTCGTFFKILAEENIEICYEYIEATYGLIEQFVVPKKIIDASEVFRLSKYLPKTFCYSFFTFCGSSKWASNLISSLNNDDQSSFISTFFEGEVDKFTRQYASILYLANEYNKLELPSLKKYIDFDEDGVSISNDMLMKLKAIDAVQEIRSRNIHSKDSSNKTFVSKPIINEINTPQKTKIEIERNCYVSIRFINKRFDLKKLVKYLTSKNELSDLVFVESVNNNEQDVEDCLTYFFDSYNDEIKNKIKEGTFNKEFKLKWNAHAASLRLLIRLLLNNKKGATVENVIDLNNKKSSYISDEYVDLLSNESGIWPNVAYVFGYDEDGIRTSTIKDNGKKGMNIESLRTIAKIVFSCKKGEE